MLGLECCLMSLTYCFFREEVWPETGGEEAPDPFEPEASPDYSFLRGLLSEDTNSGYLPFAVPFSPFIWDDQALRCARSGRL